MVVTEHQRGKVDTLRRIARRNRAHRVIVLSTILAATAAMPVGARAATTVVGSVGLPAGGSTGVCGSGPCTVLQGQVAPASMSGYVLSSPVDGTITAWSYRSGNATAGDVYALRLLRPANPDQTSFTVIATTAAPALADGSDEIRGPYPVNIPVRAGDRIGLRGEGPGDFGVPILVTGQNDPSTGDGIRYFAPDVADGSTAAPSNPGNGGQQVLVQATIQYSSQPAGCPPTCPPAPRGPGLKDLTVTPTDFSPAHSGPVFGPPRLEPRGAVIRFRLTQDAQVCFTIERRRRKRKPNPSVCGKPRGVWSFTWDGHSGANAFGFRGRIRPFFRGMSADVRLSSGRYWLVAVAKNVNGQSAQRSTAFNVLP